MTVQGTRIRLMNGHTYEVREDYRAISTRIKDLEWSEFRGLKDNARITIRTSAIAALEDLAGTGGQS